MGLNCTKCHTWISKTTRTGEHSSWCDEEEELIDTKELELEALKEVLLPTLDDSQRRVFEQILEVQEALRLKEHRDIS